MRRLACLMALFGLLAGSAHAAPDDIPSGDADDEEPAEDDAAPVSDDDVPPLAPDLDPTTFVDNVPRAPRMFREISYDLPQVPLTAVAVSPVDDEIILVGADGFVFKTDDGGESWRPMLTFARGLVDEVFFREQREQRLQDDPLDATLLPQREAGGDTGPDLGDEGVSDDGVDEEADRDEYDDPDDFGSRRGAVTSDTGLATGDEDDLMPEGDVDLVTMQGLLPPERPGVRQIAFTPDGRTLFVATARGLWRSRDVGETFQAIELPGGEATRDVRAVALDPGAPERVFVGTRDGLFLSTDGGASFIPLITPRQAAVLALSVERVGDELVVHVGDAVGIVRSWDGGATFLPLLLQGVSAFEPVSVVAFDPRTQTTYAGTPNGLFVGERKAAILERRLDLSGLPVAALSVDPQRRRGVAIGLEGQGLVISDDTGLTFVDPGDALPASDAMGLSRIPSDPDALVVATERGLFDFHPGTGILVAEDKLRILEDAWRREPTLAETVDAALAYHRVHPRMFRALSWRTKLGALAPTARLQYRLTWGRRYVDQDDYVLFEDEPEDFDEDEVKDLIELYDLGVADFAPQRGLFHSVFATLTWDFDRLVFNPSTPAVMRLRPLRLREEERLANRVHALYVARRRLLAQLAFEGVERSPSAQIATSVRLQELDSLLDGLTGGAFTEIATTRGGGLDPVDPFRLEEAQRLERHRALRFTRSGAHLFGPRSDGHGASAPGRSR